MSSSGKPISVTDVAIILLAMACGALVLGYRLSWQDFWWDEHVTLMFTRSTWSELLIDYWALDTHRPLYYALQKGWNAIFGESLAAVRSLPIVLMLPIVPLFYLTARRLFVRPAATLVAFALVTVPMFVEQGREIRMYSLMNLALAASLLVAVLLAERAQNQRLGEKSTMWLWVGFAALQSFALYAQALAVFVTTLFGLWILLAVLLRLLPVQFLIQALLAFVLYLVLSIPALIPFYYHLTGTLGSTFWIPKPSFEFIYAQLSRSYEYPSWGKALLLGLLVWGLWSLRKLPHIALLLGLMVIGLPTLVLLVSFVKPIFIARVVAWGAICSPLIIVAGLVAIRPTILRWFAVAAYSAVQITAVMSFFPRHIELSPYDAMASAFATFDPKTDTLVLGNRLLEAPMRWYFPVAFEGASFGLNYRDENNHNVIDAAFLSEFVSRAYAGALELPEGRIFVVRELRPINATPDGTSRAVETITEGWERQESVIFRPLQLDIFGPPTP